MKRPIIAALIVGLLPASLAWAQPPTLSVLVPLGIQPGKATDVVFHGGNVAGPTTVWTTCGAAAELTPGVEKNGENPAQVSYRLTAPADAALGVVGVRLVTGKGVSNVRLMLLDDLPSAAENGTNKTRETAQAVALPVAIDGGCDPESSDFYKFTVAAGQRVSIEAFARRLGSPLDPAIRLLAADGRELAYSDDEPASGADSRLTHTFAEAGEYVLEIRDIRYQGGGHFYRLRIGDFPLPSVPYPLAATKGSAAQVQVTGASVALDSPLAVTMPPQVPGDRLNVAAGYGANQGSSWVTLLATDAPDQLEQEPNDAPEASTAVTLPGALEGRFELPQDRDFFAFQATKGQRLVFRGQTRSLGSPGDLFMRLYNADGGALSEAEDNGADEGAIDYTFPADGLYRLRVEDTHRRGGPDRAYRIAVEPYQAGFTLEAAAEKVDAPQNGVFVVKVTCVRRDYNGPITLSVEGAGEGCQLQHNIIPEGKPETTLHCTLGSSLAAGQIAQLKIVGQAKIGEQEFRATASTLVALRAALSGLPFPPAVLDSQLALGVGPVFPQFFQLASAAPAVSLVKSGAVGSLKVQLTRSNGFDDKVNVSLDGLPKGVTAKPAAIEKGQTEVAVELTSAETVAPGKHPIKVVGSATFQNQPQRFTVEQVAVEGPPFAIAVAPAGPLAAGGKQKATLALSGELAPLPSPAGYQGGVTRGADGPRAPALPGFEGDNKSAAFSGIDKAPGDDRLTAELPIANAADYTLELWLYNTRDLAQPNAPAISGYVASRAGTPGAANAQPGDHLGIGGVESAPRDKLFFYNGETLVPGRTTLALNTWHHVVLVRTGDQVRVYLNGEVATPEIQLTAPRNFNSNLLTLGTRSDGYAPFQGRLDEVAVFDTALSVEQVQAHFGAAKAATPARDVILKDNPLAYWRLDETEGQLATSIAPAHKRLVRLAWRNLPAGVSVPGEIVLVEAQDKAEVELAAGADVPAGKLENIVVAGTTTVAAGPFTAESAPAALDVTKP
ncbi:MAG: LamG-like jellyroll fold domain-containing protein [Pirellulales bacterium]